MRPKIWLALLGAVVWALPAVASARIYTFVDENGITHFSNVPNDDRYTVIVTTEERRERRRIPRNFGYDGLISLTARQHKVPPALVKAVIAAESAFNARAVSRKGAQGLMQLMPTTAAALGVQNPLRADDNVQGGVRYLRAMLDRYGNMGHALAAYNAGPTAVDRYRGIPPYQETRDYVRRVLTYYRYYHGDFGP